MIENNSYFVLQYKVKRRGADWVDYNRYTTLELAHQMYNSASASGLSWWKNKHLRVIHRTLREEVIPLSNDK